MGKVFTRAFGPLKGEPDVAHAHAHAHGGGGGDQPSSVMGLATSLLLATVTCLLLDLFSRLVAVPEFPFLTLFAPEAGLALALILLGGLKFVPAILLGNLAAGFSVELDPVFIFADSLALVIGILTARSFINRFWHLHYALERIHDVMGLLLAVGLSALVSCSLFVLSMVSLDPGIPTSSVNAILATDWLAETLGMLVVTPFLLVWKARTKMNWRNQQIPELSVWLCFLIVFGMMVFGNWAPSDTLSYPLDLATFPLMAWAAIRFGQRGVTTGIIILALIAFWTMIAVLGPDQKEITTEPFWLWVFVGVLSSTGLFLAAVLTEVKQREEESVQNEARLRAFIEAMPDASFIIDAEGRYREVFSSGAEVYRSISQNLVGRLVQDCWPQETARRFEGVIERTIKQLKVTVEEYPLNVEGREVWFEGRVAPLASRDSPTTAAGVVWITHEITKRKQAESKLKERDAALEAASEAEQVLLTASDLKSGMEESLPLIGRGLQAACVLVMKVEPLNGEEAEQKIFLKQRFAWKDAGICATDPELHGFACDLRENPLFQRLRSDGAFAARIGELSGQFRGFIASQEIEYLALAPVRVGPTLWGVLLLGRSESGREFRESEVSVLRMIAGSVGGFFRIRDNEEALREAKEVADQANAAKGEFLAMMSHEIRTPMNAIIGFADLLRKTNVQDDQGEYIDIITRSGHSLLELINNILDYSKIESRAIELEYVPFSMEQVVVEALELILVKARQKGVKVTYSIDRRQPDKFIGDAYRLRQILLNLANNAVKFTDEGNVRVTVQPKAIDSGDQAYDVMFSVRDTGIGIDADKLDRLFQPFSQVDSSTTRQYGGTGLGLVICKRLVEKMGGEIKVESEPGKGTLFRFSIRLSLAKQTRPPYGSREGEPLDHSFAAAYPLKILLAEDDPVNQDLTKEILNQLGYTQVQCVRNGQLALEALKAEPFDVVLMDVQMPLMDGLELTERVRSGELGETVKEQYIIAVTAFALQEDQEKCLSAGTNDYLSKPLIIDELKDALVRACRARADRENNGLDAEDS